jgi:hypothetical protein
LHFVVCYTQPVPAGKRSSIITAKEYASAALASKAAEEDDMEFAT